MPEQPWKYRIVAEMLNEWAALGNVVEVKSRDGKWAKGHVHMIVGIDDQWVFVPQFGVGSNEGTAFILSTPDIWHLLIRARVINVQGGVL